MKKLAALLLLTIGPAAVSAQPIVDIGLFPASGDTLEVRLRPTDDFAGIVDALVFTIAWPEASNASLGSRTMSCPDGLSVSPSPLVINGGMRYRTFNGFADQLLGDWGCSWAGNTEIVLMRVPVVNNVGIDQFHIASDAYTLGSNTGFHVSLNGFERTGIIYSNMDPGPGNGVLQGWRFLDQDGDCLYDPEDIGIPHQVMQLLPGPISVITGSNGFYDVLASAGDYTLDQSLIAGVFPACPPSELVPVTIDAGVFGSLDITNTADDLVDIEVSVSSEYPRTGFTYPAYVFVQNRGFSASGPIALTFSFDSGFDLVSSEPAPDGVDGSTLDWAIASLPPFGSASVELHIAVPADPALLGTAVVHQASVSTSPDIDLTNNTATDPTVVVGSFDPNDKTAHTSSGASAEQFFIDLDGSIDYRIRFQNTGNYPAWQVVVTDTLDETLDMSSFQQGLASDPFDVRFLPGRVVEWTFTNINLPDSASDEPGSHGQVNFRIRPTLPLLPGTVISNTANIYFDFNPPVITEPSVLTAEFSTDVHEQGQGRLRLYPNPASETITLAMPAGTLRPAGLSVWSADGRLVRLSAGKNGTFDVRSLEPGLYSVRLAGSTARFLKL